MGSACLLGKEGALCAEQTTFPLLVLWLLCILLYLATRVLQLMVTRMLRRVERHWLSSCRWQAGLVSVAGSSQCSARGTLINQQQTLQL